MTTVGQLIAVLSKLPPEAPVFVDAHRVDTHTSGIMDVWGLDIGAVAYGNEVPNRTWGFDGDDKTVIIEAWDGLALGQGK